MKYLLPFLKKPSQWIISKLPEKLQPFCYKIIFSILHYVTILFQKYTLESNLKKLLRDNNFNPEKKVQLIQPSFYDLEGKIYLSGGAERYICDLANLLKKKGYEPYLVQMGHRFFYLNHNGLKVIGVKSRWDTKLLNKLAHNKCFGTPKLRIYSSLLVANPIIDKNSIGINHGMFWSSNSIYSHLINQLNSTITALPAFVAVDSATIAWFRGMLPDLMLNLKKPNRYIPNYVDSKVFFPKKKKDDSKIRIIYPRRIYNVCGFYLLNEIVGEIVTKYPNVEFHFVGQSVGKDKKAVDTLVNTHPKQVYTYFQPANKMNEIYNIADIVVIPTTINEGTSLACIESMATARAIIATNVGGLSDLIINRFNGLLAEPNSLELKKAIETLINDSEMRSRLGKNAFEVSKAFSKKYWDTEWSELIDKMLENGTKKVSS